jgi:hypothetical protein
MGCVFSRGLYTIVVDGFTSKKEATRSKTQSLKVAQDFSYMLHNIHRYPDLNYYTYDGLSSSNSPNAKSSSPRCASSSSASLANPSSFAAFEVNGSSHF